MISSVIMAFLVLFFFSCRTHQYHLCNMCLCYTKCFHHGYCLVLSSSPWYYFCCRFIMDLLLHSPSHPPLTPHHLHHLPLLSFILLCCSITLLSEPLVNSSYLVYLGIIVTCLPWLVQRMDGALASKLQFCLLSIQALSLGIIMHVSMDVCEGGRSSSSVHPFFMALCILVIFHFFPLHLHHPFHHMRW